MSADHIKTMPICEECHSTMQWAPLTRMNHDVVTGSCINCHDGSTATGKSPTHVQSDDDCEQCHNTTNWRASAFDHTSVTPGTCFSCHNGTRATGKSGLHIPGVSNTCDECHSKHSILDFDRLGFDKTIQNNLINLNIKGLVTKYETFYFPQLFD